jgi:uncharacterized protein (TIGR02266 family)
MAPTGREQRRHRRQTVRIRVDYQSDRFDEEVRSDYATTLGAGGLFIECEEALPPATPLKLRFRLPQREELHELEGRVTWRRDAHQERNLSPGMGVQFNDGPARTKLARGLDDLD